MEMKYIHYWRYWHGGEVKMRCPHHVPVYIVIISMKTNYATHHVGMTREIYLNIFALPCQMLVEKLTVLVAQDCRKLTMGSASETY